MPEIGSNGKEDANELETGTVVVPLDRAMYNKGQSSGQDHGK